MAHAQSTYRGQFGGHFHSGGHQFNGSQIHARDMHFHSPPNVRPSPSCILPYPRNRDFIEQVAFRGILCCLVKPGDRAALVGLGGIGKSQLAIEYAYRVSDVYPHIWVFWVHATNAARFKESYQSIASKADVPNLNTSDPMGSILNWLSSEESGQWLMILDNADDPSVVLEPLDNGDQESGTIYHSIAEYLPVSRGSILITTRNKEIARELVHHSSQIIQLKPMSMDQAVSLLHKRLLVSNHHHEKAALEEIAEKLDCMPLALSQAAAFINQQSPRMTVARYVAELNEIDSGSTRFLKNSTGGPWRNREASNCIVLTWHITFRCIAQYYSGAAELLSLMSFFDREAISATLLKGNYSISTFHNFDGDIQVLRDFDLVTIGEDPNVFRMHRLVQLSICDWLETKSQLQSWAERGMTVLREAIMRPPPYDIPRFSEEPPPGSSVPYGQLPPDYKPKFNEFQAHIEKLWHYESPDAKFALQKADVLFHAAKFASETFRWQIATHMLEQVIEIRRLELGDQHESTIEASALLVRNLLDLDRNEEGYRLAKELLKNATSSLGTSHRVTALCTEVVALACNNSNRLEEFDSVMEDALKIIEDLDARLALADMCVDYQLYHRAGNIAMPIYSARGSVWNYNKKAVMRSMAILAKAYQEAEQFDESESLCYTLLQLLRENGLEGHPMIVFTKSTLATTYEHQRRYDEAVTVSKECCDLSASIYGAYNVRSYFLLKDYGKYLDLEHKYAS